MMLVAALSLMIAAQAWALPEPGEVLGGPAANDLRGPVRSLDEVPDDCCDITYVGFLWGGSGGSGGPGVTTWPGGTYTGNYGQLGFAVECPDEQIDTAYAYCFDLDHGLEWITYPARAESLVIGDDSCSAEQLIALGYILAWHIPFSTYGDDVVQMAVWKLTTDKDETSPTEGIPFFCIENTIDAGYPWVNTVRTDNADRNNDANDLVLDALAHNVALDDDVILPSSDPAVVGPTESTVTVRGCLERGSRALAVGNTGLEGIRVNVAWQVGLGTPHYFTAYTDAGGCVEFDITQPISGNSYDDATVTFCTRAGWPVEVTACDQREAQDLLVSPQDPTRICATLTVPGDQWLPVELTSFTAVGSDEGVDLMWRTASETDVDHWEIERARTGNDEFAVMAVLNAHNTATGGEYHYYDRLGVPGYRYDYRLVDVSLSGERTVHPQTASAVYGDPNAGRVTEYELGDAYPNPFNPRTTIGYAIPESDVVTIKVFDISGREVAQLASGYHEKGEYSVTFNGVNLASGTYFYTMKSGHFSMTKKLMLLK